MEILLVFHHDTGVCFEKKIILIMLNKWLPILLNSYYFYKSILNFYQITFDLKVIRRFIFLTH